MPLRFLHEDRILCLTMNRVIAVVIALLIVSPPCWCCMVEPMSHGGETHSCCEQKGHEDGCPFRQGSKKDGVCIFDQVQRDAVTVSVITPTPDFTVMVAWTWPTLELTRDFSWQGFDEGRDRHPPWSWRPLFQSYCTRLL